jgi:glycosyltransferase involved in cell wall biosynthesis
VKILWVCPFFPYPPDNGTRIREYFLLRELSNWNEVSAFSLVQSRKELENTGDLNQFCQNVWGVLPQNKLPEAFFDGKRRVKDVVAGLFLPKPQFFYGKPSPNVVNELRSHIEEENFDVVVIEHLSMSNYVWDSIGKSKQPLWVLSQENVESLIQKQHISLANGWVGRLRKIIYYRSFIRFESYACKRYDHVLMVSENDRRDLLKYAPSLPPAQVSLLPNGVDVSNYDIGNVEPQENTLIYNGAITYNANYDAVQFFLREILPIIQREIPQVKVKITGKTTGADLDSLPLNENVIFTGYVSDIRPVIKSSTACIVPLQVGGGTRLKILEALALGTPVVTTSKGAEGLDMRSGRDLLVADSPADFARAVIRVLYEPELRDQLRVNGRKAVEAYDSYNIAENLHKFLLEKLEKRQKKV